MGDDGKEQSLVSQQQDKLGDAKERTIEDVQRDILQQVLELVSSPKAITLTYPNAVPFEVAHKRSEPDYDNGSQTRFVVLKAPGGLGLDELCVAVVNNRSRINDQSLGSPLARAIAGIGEHSQREIAVMRFVQTPSERLIGAGTYYMLGLSDTVPDLTGRFSLKAKAYREVHTPGSPQRENIKNFAERWRDGSAQLAGRSVYDCLGEHQYFLADDYSRILTALRAGQINEPLTSNVANSEETYKLAKISRPDSLPSPPPPHKALE